MKKNRTSFATVVFLLFFSLLVQFGSNSSNSGERQGYHAAIKSYFFFLSEIKCMINSCNSRALSSTTRNHQYTLRERKVLICLAGMLTPHNKIMFHFDKVNYAKPINWGLLRTTNQFFSFPRSPPLEGNKMRFIWSACYFDRVHEERKWKKKYENWKDLIYWVSGSIESIAYSASILLLILLRFFISFFSHYFCLMGTIVDNTRIEKKRTGRLNI